MHFEGEGTSRLRASLRSLLAGSLNHLAKREGAVSLACDAPLRERGEEHL